MKHYVEMALQEAHDTLVGMLSNDLLLDTISSAGGALAEALGQGCRVFSCGNGGSMCDAIHFAEELSGRYRNNRSPLGAAAISDVGHMTCVSNDYGYDHVFSRYIEGHGRSGDFLLAISTSGSSKSVLNAVAVAKSKGMKVIGMHGQAGSALAQMADFDICTPGGRFADRVQECHIKVIHIIIELVERRLFGENWES